MATTEVNAVSRSVQGTGASRRLRRSGKLPGILYGANQDAEVIELDHSAIMLQLRHEAFHASILTMNIDGTRAVSLSAMSTSPMTPTPPVTPVVSVAVQDDGAGDDAEGYGGEQCDDLMRGETLLPD